MIWPRHDNVNESYLDIGNHLVEKNGLYLERFTIWDNFEMNLTKSFSIFIRLMNEMEKKREEGMRFLIKRVNLDL